MSIYSARVNELDKVVLAEYLSAHVADFSTIQSIQKFAGGQSNPTFKLTTENGNFVLRRQPPGQLLKSAHAVDREYRVLQALAATNVPVAKVYHLCEDTAVIGSMFYLMEYVEGRIFWDSALPEFRHNQARSAIYDQMNMVMTHLHSVDVEKVGLLDYGKSGNYFERQLGRWHKQYRLSETHRIEPMERLIKWLEAELPADDGRVSLVHGDYRLDNLMIHSNKPEIAAVLDWELSTLGHPFADLAYQCMQLRLPSNVDHAPGLGGVDRTGLGIPTEQAYVQKYCQRMGLASIDHWSFYLAFSFFRLAAIAQGVAKRALDGNASSPQAKKVGAMVLPLAQFAIDLIERG